MAAEVEDLEALIGRIPACCSTTTPELRCCCGRTECAYLKHNCVALDDLEKEVRTAAQLGQALLVRHEQYMHDAEKDRMEMSAKIEKLELDKKALEQSNAKNIEENRGLLNQLEELNTTVTESETHIKSLETTLQATRQELRKLEGLASRTHDLEVQLVALEQEQELLQKTVITTQEEERSAIQRWKKAERRLVQLSDQLEKIEREARDERERHVEVLGRMERQRAVERELDTAAGRLKGAAAATTGIGKNGSNVVSHFVKDILQDNANLQMGIVELREMLMNSNEEVQLLREQLLLHQPILDNENGSGPPTLKAELASKEPPEPQIISQALHIHHHYHTPKKEEIQLPDLQVTDATTPSDVSQDTAELTQDEEPHWTSSFQPTLRRTTSHESILSISGIDIHTLKSRPSQATIGRNPMLRPYSRLGTPIANNSDNRSIASSNNSNEGIGGKLGGWVFGRWGISPAKPHADLRGAASRDSTSGQRAVSTPAIDPTQAFMARPPGINQKGPIPGFMKKTVRTPSQVKPHIVDHDALREVLNEGRTVS
ncbi:hypothetical protein NA56DRAFT_621981 [Hyaloscypha hepaticicola]|uniref:Uncharacterized protein n=1 Tax=Hyaloscypha hepaticicola TaxID=2082293 RepID=A0A2J6QBK2_9HELO|nr:hypothetical protein NA56DRAFT_621981 [Hyaloscypha hepaticicola]